MQKRESQRWKDGRVLKKQKQNNLLIEGIPLCVDLLQVVLELLGVGAFGCCLDQTLAEGVDVLKLHLQRVNVFFLEGLKTDNRANESKQSTCSHAIF